MKSSEFLQTVIDEPSNAVRVELLRPLIFRVYTECLASGATPNLVSFVSKLPTGESASFELSPVIDKVDTFGGLVKTLFSSKSAGDIEVVPCRVEDVDGSGVGLMILAKEEPMIVIGDLAENCLSVRQMAPPSRNSLGSKALENARPFARALVKPLASNVLFTRKPK